jgi:hypothetical protein
MVTPVWNTVELRVDAATPVRDLKRAALRELKVDPDGDDYVVKYRGALVLDESRSLDSVGAVPNAPFIVLHARRQPVR